MKYLVNSREMRQYDQITSGHFKVPSLLLMEQAALACTEELEKCIDKAQAVLIVCGTGNNGGDGLAVGRMLMLKGYQVEIVLVGDRKKASEQNARQQEILLAYGVELKDKIPDGETYGNVIDAIFGVGLTREIGEPYKSVIEEMNKKSGLKVALDVPSGVSADDGAILGVAFRADITITFAFDKVGLHLWPGNECCGQIVVKEIGITKRSFLEQFPEVKALEPCDLELLKNRPSHSNKGTFGKVLVIAGSVNMAGAALLAGKSAYASGCGLIRILTPEENRIVIQTGLPEAVLSTYCSKETEWEGLEKVLEWADVILCGPGIGISACSKMLVEQVLRKAKVPVVLDADALNIISFNTKLLLDAQTDVIVTPHLGEMSRLIRRSVADIQKNLLDTAKEFARTYHVTCVLKDERTVIATARGELFLNLSGNSGMATAGSGDVLAGCISGLLAQRMRICNAVPLGVYLHGAAGDMMVQKTGQNGLMASDICEGIRCVFACTESRIGIL